MKERDKKLQETRQRFLAEMNRENPSPDFNDLTLIVNDKDVKNIDDRRTKCPKEALEAWNRWVVAEREPISVDDTGYFYCDWRLPDLTIDGITELKEYIYGFKWLWNLLLKSKVLPEAFENLKIFDAVVKDQRQRGLWLEYYLLNDLNALAELGFSSPNKRQHTSGRMAMELYKIAQEIWKLAKLENHPLCTWVLSYNSPAQIWFGSCVAPALSNWVEMLTLGASPNNTNHYKNELKEIERWEKKENLNIEVKSNTLTFNNAYVTTVERLIHAKTCSGIESGYLEARRAEANFIRKSKGKVKVCGYDKNGNLPFSL